jgi:phosphotransferase system IIA component
MFDALKKMFEKNAKIISVKAAEDGRTIPMDQVNDQTFAQELLGPGIAIHPSSCFSN